MAENTVEVNTKNLEIAIRIFPKELKREIGDGMDHISRKFLNLFRETRLQGAPGIKGRSGGIFTHFGRASLVSKDIEGMGMTIFSDSKIAKLQEEGGRVTNPSGGKLAVPLSARAELFTADGRLKSQYRQPRLIKNIMAIRLNSKTFLAKVRERAAQIRTLFVLKKSVMIPPRLGFYMTWNSMQDERIKILNRSVTNALDKTK